MSDIPPPSPPGPMEPMTPLQALAARVRRANANTNSGVTGSSPAGPTPTPGASSRPGSPVPPGAARGQQRARSDFEDESDEPVATALIPYTPTSSLVLLAPVLKRARRLGIQAEADLDIFLAAPLAERTAYQYALSLSNNEALTTLSLHLDYKLPGTLRITCSDYAWAYMLSPTITSYRTSEGADTILAVMRDLNVSDLPPRHETGRCEEVIRVIGKAMITCRHHVKEKTRQKPWRETSGHCPRPSSRVRR
ncbi:hypothetical protein OH76DRAFT_1419778 [Lentinus brumalis]|uniref:Uncharacterized protein n=1 Tax=Lentinus brumalis TaxID=2498619 RepID=A0A371D3M8_9APHY|nr:hypothetical protein OH76DRAFT_1419778 [Polyporus brumalis]